MGRRSFLAILTGGIATPALLGQTHPPRSEPWNGDPSRLELWKRSPRIPILRLDDAEKSASADLGQLIAATESRRELKFRYFGGSTPGERRQVSPGLLFRVEGFTGIYLSGFCHTRRAERVFRVDLIDVV
jgi:hypothetical protein